MNGQKPEAQAGYRVETFSLKNTSSLRTSSRSRSMRPEYCGQICEAGDCEVRPIQGLLLLRFTQGAKVRRATERCVSNRAGMAESDRNRCPA